MVRAVCMLASIGVGVIASAAHARPLDCPELYNFQFRAALDEVDKSFEATEIGRAQGLLEKSHERIPCLIEIVEVEDFARYAVQRAFSEALLTETEEAIRWAKLARALDPAFQWPAYVPENHITRRLLEDEAPLETTTLRGKGLRPDPGGGVFLDGRYLVRPEGEAGVPHLLQVGDATGDIWLAAWQDGVVFPDDVLGPPSALPDELPLWYGKPPGTVKGPRPVRARRLGTSLGFAVASGTLFTSAWVARSAYLERPTDGLQRTVNGATLASATAGSLAVGTFTVALFTQR